MSRTFPVDPAAEALRLSLYMTRWCGYCSRVRRVMDELDIEDRIELRDIDRNPDHAAELRAARGRRTVPVLRIQWSGNEAWMPESADIAEFLRRRFIP